MPQILAAGDHFVRPALFARAITERAGGREDLRFSELMLPWPLEPFGDISSVTEASGDVPTLIEALGEAEIAVTQMAPFTAEVFAARPALRLVGVCRGGPVNVDLEAATAAGVAVTYAPGRNAQAAAEFAVGLMLAATRRIPASDADLKRGVWRGDLYTWENAGTELSGATVGLIGYGAIGRIVARILVAFGARVLSYDPYSDPEDLARDGVESTDLETLLSASSIVSLHARSTPETHHILDVRRLALLPRGAVVVNSARGDLLDYAPLPALLESGRLGALALDVYDIEPPPADWPLLSAPNVVLTSHLAGASRQTAERAASIVADDVVRYLDGEPLAHLANPAMLKTPPRPHGPAA